MDDFGGGSFIDSINASPSTDSDGNVNMIAPGAEAAASSTGATADASTAGTGAASSSGLAAILGSSDVSQATASIQGVIANAAQLAKAAGSVSARNLFSSDAVNRLFSGTPTQKISPALLIAGALGLLFVL